MLQVKLQPVLNTVYFCISGVLLEAQFIYSDKHGSFLQFLDFTLSQYFAQLFSEPFFQLVPVAPVITGMAFVFIFHIFCVSIVRSLCFRIFSSSFFITFLSSEPARSNRIHVPLYLIMDYGIRFIVMDDSVCLHCSFHIMCSLPSFQNMFTVILLSFHVKEAVKLMKLQISYHEGTSLFHSSSLF